MVKEFTPGPMDVDMKENMFKIKKKEKENMSGPMEENIKVSGKMENKMAMEFM